MKTLLHISTKKDLYVYKDIINDMVDAFDIEVEHYRPYIDCTSRDIPITSDNIESGYTFVLKNILMDNNCSFYLIKFDGKVAGYLSTKLLIEENCLYLSQLYIRKPFRSKGLFRFTIENLMVSTKEIVDMDRISLDVFSKNPAYQMYKHIGFEDTVDGSMTITL